MQGYDAVLALNPSNGPALHLSAVALFQLGDADEALLRIEAALPVLTEQPQVWGSYGVILAALGRPTDAAAAYRRGLTLDPDDGVLWFNLGLAERDLGQTEAAITALGAAACQLASAHAYDALGATLQMAGRSDEAVEAYRNALDLGAGAETALNAGAACHRLGDARVSEAFFRQALELDPACVQALNNLSVIAQDAGDHARAAELCRSAIALNPGFADAHNNLGVALQRLADGEAALDAYRAALAIDPAHPNAALNLTETLFELGRGEEAVAWRQNAANADTEDAETWLELGGVLDRADQLAAAATAFEHAAALDDAEWRTPHRLGEIRRRLGQLQAAIEDHRRACALAPQRPEAWRQLALAALQAGQGETAMTALAQLLRSEPFDTEGWAYQALALRMVGQTKAADAMTARRDLARVLQPPAPDGYASLAAFHQALGAELAAVRLRAWSPRGQSVVGGTQTQNDLFAQSTPAIQAFKAQLDEIIAAVLADPGEALRPFIESPPARLRYRSWSVTLKAGGHHASHIHPEGCLSGVYYVETPADASDSGALEFGRPGFPVPLPAPPPIWALAPRAGALVVFPSYLWHGTREFASAGERTTIAFDVLR